MTTEVVNDQEEQDDLQADEEQIAGIDAEDDGSWGDYPIDEFLIRHENRSVDTIVRRINNGGYLMDPDFQRDFIWDEDKQSKLIESVLLRIPLPVFYLAENEDGRVVVVDGLQRLSTFQRFLNDELALRLPDRLELNGKKFDQLPPKLQNRVEDCNLTLYTIDSKVPERARLDIFERVNGGIPLTRQQMRNCLYMGPATRFLKEEANTSLFLETTTRSLKSATMRDREFVNRFCAFQILPVDSYRGDMDNFLALTLKKMNGMTQSELSVLSKQFRASLKNNKDVFGRYSFRKHTSPHGRRSVLNASLWDVMSTGLSHYSTDLVQARSTHLRQKFYQLIKDYEFSRSITYGTNGVNQVKHRFETARAMFSEVLGDYTD